MAFMYSDGLYFLSNGINIGENNCLQCKPKHKYM